MEDQDTEKVNMRFFTSCSNIKLYNIDTFTPISNNAPSIKNKFEYN